MRRMATALAIMLVWSGIASAQGGTTKPDSGIHVRITGNLYLAPEIWPDVGMKDDQKFGVGMGGMLGLALQIDNYRLGLGPHFGYNLWMADYSHKANTATNSVNFAMGDVGLEVGLSMDDIVIYLGKGKSTMEAYMMLDNGSKVTYPTLDGAEFGYQAVGFGFHMKRVTLGIVHTSYDGAAKDASHLQIRFALGR